MSATYEPGTVGQSSYGRVFYMNDGWYFDDGSGPTDDASDISGFRPLVVLDPEDRVTLQKFAAWTADGDYADWRIDWVRNFLRSLIATPKPAEPTGLGAQVRDRDGEMWVRNVQGAWINLHGRYGLDPARTWDGLCEKYGPIEVSA